MSHRNNYDYLTKAPIHRVILSMSVPTIISMLVTSVYNFADTYFVSQLNTQSTGAVGIVFTVMSVFQAFGFFFGQGSGNFISRSLGAREEKRSSIMAATSFVYAIAFGILLMFFGLLFLRPLSNILGSTSTILPYTERYLGIILLGAPFIIGSLTLNQQIRFQGNASYAMYGIMSGAFLNILLDPLLIFVFGWGITGAAIATVSSQFVSFMILLWMTTKGSNQRIHLRHFSFSSTYVKEIVTGGTPSVTRQGLGSLASWVMNVVARGFGDAAIAALSIVIRIVFVVMSIVIGLGHGYQPLCGFCYGGRLYDRVFKGYWFSVKVGTAFLLVVSVFGILFAPDIIRLFRDEAELVSIGSGAMRWQFLTLPLCAFIMLSNMMMQTINKPVSANILAASRRGLFYIPALLILPQVWGLEGLEACQAIADIFAFAVALPVVYFEIKKIKGKRQSK